MGGASEHLTEAVRRQFGWVLVLAKNPKETSRVDRQQAWVLCALHICFALMLVAHAVTVVASWALAFILQLVDVAIAVLYYTYLRRYQEKRLEAMEVERLGNPLMIAQMAVRAFALLHAFLMGSKTMLFTGLLEVAYNFYVSREHSLLVDATKLWREVQWRDRDAAVRWGFQMVMMVLAVAHFLLSMVLSRPD